MSRKRKPNPILESVLIEQVAAEGNSIARVDGKVLFVPQTIPGDIVDVQITKKKSAYLEGKVIKIVKPSDDRLEPFCTHYGVCGGCKWQSLPYKLQLEYKQQQVLDQLTRIGKLELPDFQPILASEDTTEYRNKLEFTFSDRRWVFENEDPDTIFSPQVQLNPEDFPNGEFPKHLRKGYSSVNTKPEGFALGFHIGGFFDKIIDIQTCYLQAEPSNRIRNFIRDYAIEHKLSFFNLREQVGALRNVIIRNTQKGDLMVILSVTEPVNDLLDALIAEFPEIKSLHYVINTKANDTIGDLDIINYHGDDAIYEEMEGLKFKIGPKSFYQTNSKQAYELYSIVREFAELQGGERIFDLYTGTGTIALFLARNASEVVGVEYVPEAIEDAKINAKNNDIDNCTFYAGDMKDILTADFIEKNGGTPDVMVLDPPRAGIHADVIEVILAAQPQKIIYVSCNPATQARDLAALSQDYIITKVRPVDMFPHTHHVENVVALIRK